jgi:MFS transporter, ACS family, tartrate transporter
MPGVVLYLTYWFPPRYRARAVAGYIIAGSFSAVLGGPISTSVMTWFDGAAGLHGWQWMFIAEGVPTILLGCFALYYLTDRPAKASWLTKEQAEWLEAELASERAEIERQGQHRLIDCILDPRVWLLATLFGCALVGIYGLLLWLPQIIKSMGHLTNIEVGFLSAIPPLLGVIGTILVSKSSDRTGDRKFHLAGVYLLAAIGMLLSAYVQSPVLSFVFLCIAGFGLNSGNPLFWSINASLMTGAAGAATIATVNTLAQFGGLIGPWCIGLIKNSTGSFSWALVGIAGFLIVASAIAATMRVKPREPEIAETMRSSVAH